MKNPLANVPLNWLRQYVLGISQTGCKIYMPVDSMDQEVQDGAQADLQAFLDNQVIPPLPPMPLMTG